MPAETDHTEETPVSDEQIRTAEDNAAASVDAAPKRRWVKPAIVVAAILAAVFIVSGVIAVQPAVIGSRDAVKGAYETWTTSKHDEVSCQGCHASPALTSQAGYTVKMIREMYLGVFGADSGTRAFEKPTNAACLACHKDLITTSPKGDLVIPHKAHVDILKVPCVRCHDYLVHEKSPEGAHTPTMAGCLECHNGQIAKNACVVCHTAKAAPETHKAGDWLVVHDQASKATGAECVTCHGWTKDWCADCHARRPPSHTDEWRKTHGAAVAVRRNCEVCHTADFCIDCHGVVPKLNYDPSVQIAK